MRVDLFGDVWLESFTQVWKVDNGEICEAWIEIRGLGWDSYEPVFFGDYHSQEEAEKALEDEMMSLLYEIANNTQNKFVELARRRDAREGV